MRVIHQASEIFDRMPPANLDAETQVLGSILADPNPKRRLDDVSRILTADDFYAEANAVIFKHLAEMVGAGVPIDVPLLVDRLRKAGDIERAGGTARIAETLEAVAVSAHATFYASAVLQASRKRQLIHAAQEVMRQAWQPDTEPDDCLAAAEKALAGIRTGSYGRDPVSMFDAVTAATRHIDAIAAGKAKAGCPTGLHAFDEQLGGFHPGELVILAARTGQGKTSLALQVASHMASVGRAVYYASLEMGSEELALKLLCSEAGVSTQRVRSGSLTDAESRFLAEAGQRIAFQNLHLHDWPAIRPFDIGRAARRLRCEIVFIDYLQIVSPPDDSKAGKRYEQVGAISRDLKQIAREMRVPVVALAQVGRQADQTREGRPRLSHLRESGSIEQDADAVCLLWRPEGGIGDQKDNWSAELAVEKNRHGPNARIRLDWDGPRTRFACHEIPTGF